MKSDSVKLSSLPSPFKGTMPHEEENPSQFCAAGSLGDNAEQSLKITSFNLKLLLTYSNTWVWVTGESNCSRVAQRIFISLLMCYGLNCVLPKICMLKSSKCDLGKRLFKR